MIHLIFDCLYAPYHKIKQDHPIKVMQDLGIIYQFSTPQSVADQWWFWNCENVPNKLPPFLKKMDNNPLDCIGFGLSQEIANQIISYKRRKP